GEDGESRVGRRIPKLSPPFDGPHNDIPCGACVFRAARPSERSNRSTRKFANYRALSDTSADPKTNGAISPGLPRDVWIEPDEPGMANEVVDLRQLSNKFCREERRTHARPAVGVVDPNPQDH